MLASHNQTKLNRTKSKQTYVHNKAQPERSMGTGQKIQAFAARYFSLGIAALVVVGTFFTFNASAAPPLASIDADSFSTTHGSSIKPVGSKNSNSVAELNAGSNITKNVSVANPVAMVSVRAKASGQCNGKWQSMQLLLNDEPIATGVINSKKFSNYDFSVSKPAGDYTLKLSDTMPDSCKETITVDLVKVFGTKGKKPTAAPPTDQQPQPTPTPASEPSATPTPLPSVAPTPAPTEPTPTPVVSTETCPHAPHTPGGSDTAGGCWPYEGNTGIPSGTTLTNYTGPCTITSPTAIDAKTISCDIVVKAPLIVTRSVINGHFDSDYGQTLEISDSEVHAGNTAAPGVGYSNITIRRTEITGGQHSVLCSSNCIVEDSWLHDQYNPDGGSTHNNAYLSNGGENHTIRHNSLFCSPKDNTTGGGCTADAAIFGDYAPMSKVTFDNNLFVATPSGGYCGTFGLNPTKPYGAAPTGIAVINNVFQRGSNLKCGVNGPVTSFLSSNGNIWSNNIWDDGSVVNPTE